ncbi:hypothetical protein BU25DRAFT_456098 [Macroventuria anomochaeta]|uniref:Uncharacterized protein n=1 Tax=Macroventuria anomochaeta TaxID=301207 RepID=A0ACB6SAU9_9PLEO|nr:uncharacterized protein BU25DRAFT_456098 [Macroventuria anomochaeta]KAF2630354.1 hypothetical protein BU25DRAFT_456098 [Macroventuria anomochaeta]
MFIYESTAVEKTVAAMPYPNIAVSTEAHRYSHSPPVRRDTRQYIDDCSQVFNGPRTQLSLISTAVSSLGEIFPADLPYNNSTYSMEFFAPIVKCEIANITVAKQISDYLQEEEVQISHQNNKDIDDGPYNPVLDALLDGNLDEINDIIDFLKVPYDLTKAMEDSNEVSSFGSLWQTIVNLQMLWEHYNTAMERFSNSDKCYLKSAISYGLEKLNTYWG